MIFGIARLDDAGQAGVRLVTEFDRDVATRRDIADPIRSIAPTGEEVDHSVVRREPVLKAVRLPGVITGSGQASKWSDRPRVWRRLVAGGSVCHRICAFLKAFAWSTGRQLAGARQSLLGSMSRVVCC